MSDSVILFRECQKTKHERTKVMIDTTDRILNNDIKDIDSHYHLKFN